MRASGAGILGYLLLWIGTVQARYGIDEHAKAAYFNFVNGYVSEYVFALNVVENGDVYFHMSGPIASASWLGVGFGDQMKDSFMIVAYPSANGLNTTISTRLGSGQTEPAWTSGYNIHKVYNDTYAPNANTVTDEGTGVIIAHAICQNCSSWITGSLDTQNTAYPMIFALGPKNAPLRSDSVEASIPRHGLYGRFTMDLAEATNYTGWYGRVPAPNVPQFVFPPNDTAFATFGATLIDDYPLSDPLPGVHAALMCITFVFIFPLGAVLMRFLKQALWHAAIQGLGFVLVLAGFGVGVKVAREYTKSRNFTSGHQILGLLIVAALCIQLGLGLVHHAFYIKTNKPTPMGRVHMILGPVIIILGLINGGVGFNFAGNRQLTTPYAIVVAVIVVIMLSLVGCLMFCRSRRKYKPEPEGYPQFRQQGYSDYEMPRQPTFGEQPPEPYEPPTPYSPNAPYSIGYNDSPISPYTPDSAYTPVLPDTWKKQEISRWPLSPHIRQEFQ